MSIIDFCFIFVFAVALKAANGFALNKSDSVSIVGGDEVDITEYPYQATLLLHDDLFCGGSIIGSKYILTAAHCVSGGIEKKWLSVRVGSSYVHKGGHVYQLSDIYIHPKYTPSILDHDVAVIRTSRNMNIDNVTTKVVKMADSASNLGPGHNIVVSGWGRIKEGGPSSEVLRAVEVPVVSSEYCQELYSVLDFLVTDRMFCALYAKGGKDACNGDSGGPAVHLADGVQYGIVSWGAGCARKNFPGVYTSVPAVRHWIKGVTGI